MVLGEMIQKGGHHKMEFHRIQVRRMVLEELRKVLHKEMKKVHRIGEVHP